MNVWQMCFKPEIFIGDNNYLYKIYDPKEHPWKKIKEKFPKKVQFTFLVFKNNLRDIRYHVI